jgi:hypothetical protein
VVRAEEGSSRRCRWVSLRRTGKEGMSEGGRGGRRGGRRGGGRGRGPGQGPPGPWDQFSNGQGPRDQHTGPPPPRDQYSTEREEGRSRALEELRGALAEVGKQDRQREERVDRREEGAARRGEDWGGDWGRREEGGGPRGRRGGGRGGGWQGEGRGRGAGEGDRRGGEGEHPAEPCSDLRERLSVQLSRGVAECLVCLERVRQAQPTWDCLCCYQVFHLACIRKWAKSNPNPAGGWRCPGCQAVTDSLPADYRCFCRKQRNPDWARNEGLVPHTCGELCGRARGPECPHRCAELCHPGRCPPCTATVIAKVSHLLHVRMGCVRQRMNSLHPQCPCGRESKRQRCGEPLLCDATCDGELPCGRHRCAVTCHPGPCQPCAATLAQACHCGATAREEPCTADTQLEFACGGLCPRTLDCGQHPCTADCHPGACSPCPLAVARVTHCPCGQATLASLSQDQGTEPRTSCLDPVPVCGQTCSQPLACGPPSAPHCCPLACHPGLCPTCPLATLVRCRCGHMDQELPCAELTSRADDARCGKQCKAKRSCGRHKCGEQCCILLEHRCPLTCGQQLSCGLHRCEELCHRGKCPRCPMVSFDELSCHCGAAVLFPPVACGVRPPECHRVCSRQHACPHPISHHCHSEEACPPCTTLTVKTCYGGHEQVTAGDGIISLELNSSFRGRTWPATSRASRAAGRAAPGWHAGSIAAPGRATRGRALPPAASPAASRGPAATPALRPATPAALPAPTRPAAHRSSSPVSVATARPRCRAQRTPTHG